MAAGSLLLVLALPLLAAPLSPSPLHVRNEGALSSPVESRLEQSLAAFERDTGRRFYVAALATAGPEGPRELARSLTRDWKADLILVYVKDERRWSVAVGPAVAPTLADAEARMTVDGAAQSWFDQNEVDAALEVAAGALTARLEGRLPTARAEASSEKGLEWETVAGACVMLLLMIIVVITRDPRRRYGRVTRSWERGGVLHGDVPWSGGGSSGSW